MYSGAVRGKNLKPKGGGKKTERWQKISEEAAKQSGRGIIPEVSMPMNLDRVIDEITRLRYSVLYPTNVRRKTI